MEGEEARVRIGIDFGGTKIEGIALAGSVEVARRRVATPRDYGGSLDAIQELVAWLERMGGEPGTVGIGIPGTESEGTGLIKNANSTWLIGRPLRNDLEHRLGRPIRLMNDANCFALSEATDGAGAGANVVFGVILGTGVGGGMVIGGLCHAGQNGIAGEWGHNPLPWAGNDDQPQAECYCGKRGCIETYLSGPGMERDHLARTGRPLGSHEIVEAAGRGDSAAGATLERYRDRLGRALASVVNLLDPDVVVLGGGMSSIPGLAGAAREAMSRHVFSETLTTPVIGSRHGPSSGVRGAAWLWPEGPSSLVPGSGSIPRLRDSNGNQRRPGGM